MVKLPLDDTPVNCIPEPATKSNGVDTLDNKKSEPLYLIARILIPTVFHSGIPEEFITKY
nr:MAG TPA: hypothetical protein [Bacteriophage sp.]